MRHIKNIIFDLGGVIINLDLKRSIDEFNQLSKVSFEQLYTQASQHQLFDEFDKGLLHTDEFFARLKREIRYEGPNEALLNAWNAMLLDVPEHRLDLLVEAKQNYQTYLLSNTCEPHIASFEQKLYLDHGVKNFVDYFDAVYYSCRVGMRKPDKEIFDMVLTENNLNVEETIFIDDSIQHVKAAGLFGINSYLLPKGMEIGDLLKEINLL